MPNGAPPNQPPGFAPPAAVAALPSPEARSPTKTRNGTGFKRRPSGCKLVLRKAQKPCPRRRSKTGQFICSKTGQFYLLLTRLSHAALAKGMTVSS